MNSRKTKIICTIGPATAGSVNLVKLINDGMDIARLNFSHGTHDEHKQYLHDIREAAKITGKDVAIMQDLQGPKIRTEKVKDGAVRIEDGADFIITVDELEIGDSKRVSTSYKNLNKEVKAGNTILLDDGYLILQVEKVAGSDICTKVVKGGILKNRKGIIAPGVTISAPPLSEKDLEDLKFGLELGVDAVALSFVRSAKDIIELQAAMKIFGRTVGIVSKIERIEGYKDIQNIIAESDGIMVARGDLGLELPAEQVPIIQKDIVKKCNFHGKPVIVATQMLESMINNPRPTRAEASDVANAVLDGADCLMLSGETSTGTYPFDSVNYMDRIIRSIEKDFGNKPANLERPIEELQNISDAMGRASCVIAEQINAAAIVAHTKSGFTAKNIAKYRPDKPIFAFTEDETIMRRMNFIWGVNPMLIPNTGDDDGITDIMASELRSKGLIDSGEYAVFVSGLSSGKRQQENVIIVKAL